MIYRGAEMSDDKYIFRKANTYDATAVYALYKSVLGEEFCVWNDAYPDMLEIEADLAADDLFVLTEGEKIIGAISIVPENELDGFDCFTGDGSEIARVVIAKEYRGKGLSCKMVGEIEKILCKRGCKAIHLSVAKSNIPACKTYIKAGFKTVGEAEMYGGDYYIMEKQIKGIYSEKKYCQYKSEIRR